jgi:uracil-xanthine permease
MAVATHPVDELLPAPKLFTLGLQHVLVMYAGAIAVPLIVGRALQLSPEDVAFLISADLFVCGVVSIMQSLGVGPWFGIKLPVMMGVTFAAVGPMVSMAAANPGPDGARMIFGAIIGAGAIAILLAPLISRMLRYFPPVVTGTIILIIGITLMRVGINWIFGNPVGPTAPRIVDPAHLAWFEAATATAAPPTGAAMAPTMNNPLYAPVQNIFLSAVVLAVVVAVARFARGFLSNIAVLCGIVVGAVIAAALGMMHYEKIAAAQWFALIPPLHFGMPIFDPILILTMTLVMIVVMIESTGMFLALSDITGKKITQPELAAGLRMDGLGTIIGGLFNTFPYTSSRRTSAWSGSPASARASSASPAASSWWCSASPRRWGRSSRRCRRWCSAVRGSSCSAWSPPPASASCRPSTSRPAATTSSSLRSRSASG